eukprot:COSAG06_NODE_3504_length_5258_cov_11.424307_3_plen_118_part_00
MTVRRPQILKETPDIAFGAIGKQMGSEWREMTDAKKKPYTDKAEKAKAKYTKAKAAYGTSLAALHSPATRCGRTSLTPCLIRARRRQAEVRSAYHRCTNRQMNRRTVETPCKILTMR